MAEDGRPSAGEPDRPGVRFSGSRRLATLNPNRGSQTQPIRRAGRSGAGVIGVRDAIGVSGVMGAFAITNPPIKAQRQLVLQRRSFAPPRALLAGSCPLGGHR
jgi:hypothetical protein